MRLVGRTLMAAALVLSVACTPAVALADDMNELAVVGEAAAAEDLLLEGAEQAPDQDDQTQDDNVVQPDSKELVDDNDFADTSSSEIDTEAGTDSTDDEPDTLAEQDSPRKGSWVVDARSGSLERYWVWDDGTLAKDELIAPESGAGYWARALPDGRILRGKWDSGRGRVYVADNDGRLMGSDLTEDGWVVTRDYDGDWQRYWVDAEDKAAASGFFTVEGYGDVFGTGGQGYVLRGDFRFGNRLWSADNDGKLRSGWYVTDGFGQGLQRYWMGDEVYGSPHAAATSRLVDASTNGKAYWAWAMADGRILRGKWDSGRGRVYVADNDGRLMGSDLTEDGWVVTRDYDGDWQRYWVDSTAKAAVSGFFTVEGYGDLFGIGGQGYVLRGTLPFMGKLVMADNDGRLPSKAGWLVSNKYGHGLQRYWIEPIFGSYLGVRPGYSVEGWAHYTLPEGYVLRNGTISAGTADERRTDNDGRLTGKIPSSQLTVTSITFIPLEPIELHTDIDFRPEDGGYRLERDFLRNGDQLVVNTNLGTKTYVVKVEFGDATLVNATDPRDTLGVWAFGMIDDDAVDFDIDPAGSTITAKYMGKSSTVSVTIYDDPILSIKYSRQNATLVRGVDSYEYSDYRAGQWVSWQCYMTWMMLGDTLDISYVDGTKKSYVYKQTTRDGYPAELFVNKADESDTLDLDIWFKSDQSYENQWGSGKHYFTFDLYNRKVRLEVTVKE